MASLDSKLELAKSFILQSPPGEENDVFNDLRTIVNDDETLEQAIIPALAQYNQEQFVVVKLGDSQVLITDAGKLQSSTPNADGQDRYIDPASKTSFAFDHMKLTTSDQQEIQVNAETEEIRCSIARVLSSYVSNHYSEGVSTVYALDDANYPEVEEQPSAEPAKEGEEQPVETSTESAQEATEEAKEAQDEEAVKADEPSESEARKEEPVEAATEEEAEITEEKEQETAPTPTIKPARPSRVFGLYFVGNKYNPSNYWTGRWRASYVADLEKQTLEGKAVVNVHYYEQGNVQLSTTLISSSQLPSTTPSPEEIISLVKASESSFAAQLSDAYTTLSDDMFKSLRRTLPRSKAKLSWEKMVVYKAGQSLRAGEAQA